MAHWLGCFLIENKTGLQRTNVRGGYVQGVPRKSSQKFFVITSARNKLATNFLDMFETNIGVLYEQNFLYFWNYWPKR